MFSNDILNFIQPNTEILCINTFMSKINSLELEIDNRGRNTRHTRVSHEIHMITKNLSECMVDLG